MIKQELILYERAGCALCEHMADAVQRELLNSNVGLIRVNIDADSVLKAKFDWDVPLLFGGDSEICRHKLDIAALNNWLASIQQHDSCHIG